MIKFGYKENTMLLITRIEGSEGRRIFQFDHCDFERDLSELAKRRLLEHVEKTISHNIVIDTLCTDTSNWYLFEGMDRIILSNAAGFASFTSDDAKEIFKQRIKDRLRWRE